MKKLLILSGKGGTGKTTLSSAFVKLTGAKVYADCDVDAPNLHITVNPQGTPTRNTHYGMPKAIIDSNKCIKCGKCASNCRFGAINIDYENDNSGTENNLNDTDKIYKVDGYLCEGCGVCRYVCDSDAITMKEEVSGETLLYSENQVFSTAKLKMGTGVSGKLVYEVVKNLDNAAHDVYPQQDGVAVIDGPPGIGCPVIASMNNVNLVLLVTEPTVSGLSDLKRIYETARHFNVICTICINKYDINIENTDKIIKFCKKNGLYVIGKIPFDKIVVEAINSNKSIVEYDCEAARSIEKVVNIIMDILK